ncbi:hypothetical protein GQ55_1G178600 [Panicum hallii var. hallii]|uniref:Uncharacterized protein n=1 Tax=Panicum hallii var. hallii TaxID=1504633 RepID=A0A2T7F5Z9_9POAL|nr:hypothetical protein GQ55_1G178600 [Panicum hallii var. hallii]
MRWAFAGAAHQGRHIAKAPATRDRRWGGAVRWEESASPAAIHERRKEFFAIVSGERKWPAGGEDKAAGPQICHFPWLFN